MTFYEELEWRGVVVYEGIVDMRSADVAAEQLKPLHGGGSPACCSGGLEVPDAGMVQHVFAA